MGLKNVEGKVIIEIDLESKNSHRFEDGTVIRLERGYNNLNKRETQATNAFVISADNIPSGVEILIHPNAAIESNKIYSYKKLSGENLDSNIQYFSIPEDQCFIWKDENDNWLPLFPYETALRVFEPYTGVFDGIQPTMLKDTLFVTSGSLKGKVVKTLQACDYEIIFQDITGKEAQIIRFRPNGDEKTKREPEAIAILEEMTTKVKKGKMLVGISVTDAKPLNELVPVT